MTSEGKINLGSALEDTPQVQALASSLESYVPPVKEYASLLRDTFQTCCLHQQKVCESTDALAALLNSFEPEVCGEKDTFLSGSFAHLGRVLKELHSCQDVLSSQLENAVVALLSNFLSDDLTKLDQMKEAHENSRQEHEQAMGKYSRVSKRKDSEKARFEANADLYAARRKFYQTSLEYYSELNVFQHKMRSAMLEPLLTFMHAQVAYFKVGHGILGGAVEKVLSNINSEVQQCHSEYEREMQALLKQRQEIELQFPTLCLPDPDPSDPFVEYHPPNTQLTDKAGYLFCRISKSGLPSKWDRAYYFTKDGSLYTQLPHKPAEMLLELNDAETTAAEVDDRRYVLQISHHSIKRPIYLMAESEVSRDEWIATLNNATQGKVAELESNQGKNPESIRLERQRIRSWVNKELQEPNKKEKSSGRTSWPQLQLPIGMPKVSSRRTSPQRRSPATSRRTSPQRRSPASSKRASPQRRSPVTKRKNQRRSTELPLAVLVEPLEQEEEESEHQQTPAQQQPETGQERLPSANTASMDEMGTFCKSFVVRYLGHMEIKDNKSTGVVGEAILKVMAARALENMKPPQDIDLTVTPQGISLTNPGSKKAIGQIPMKTIQRCSTHTENEKLFGIISRVSTDQETPKLVCRVIEAEISGAKVCKAIREAIDITMQLQQAQAPRLPPPPPTTALTPTHTTSQSVNITQPSHLKTSRSVNALSSAGYDLMQHQKEVVPEARMIDTGRSCSDSNINTLDNGNQLVASSSSSSSSDFMSSFKAADTNGYPHKPESATPGSSTSESLSALMELQLEGTDSTSIVQSLPQISPTQNLSKNLSSTDTGYTSAEQFVGIVPSGSQITPQQLPWTLEPGTQGNTLSSGYVQAPVTITSTHTSITTTQTDDLISFATMGDTK